MVVHCCSILCINKHRELKSTVTLQVCLCISSQSCHNTVPLILLRNMWYSHMSTTHCASNPCQRMSNAAPHAFTLLLLDSDGICNDQVQKISALIYGNSARVGLAYPTSIAEVVIFTAHVFKTISGNSKSGACFKHDCVTQAKI